MVVGLELSPSPHRIPGAQSQSSLGYFLTSPTKVRLPQLFSLAGRPVLVDLNFFHIRIMETTELLETINAADYFSSLSISVPFYNSVSDLLGQFF